MAAAPKQQSAAKAPPAAAAIRENADDDDDESSTSSNVCARHCCKCCGPCYTCMRGQVFVLVLVCCVLIGIGLGLLLRHLKPVWSPRELAYYKFPGELLLRMLQMMILPLVVTSMISGMSLLGSSNSPRVGVRALVYYMSTTLIAVVIGIVLVLSIRPGDIDHTEIQRQKPRRTDANAADSALDLIRNIFPDNLIDACIRRVQTISKPAANPKTPAPLANSNASTVGAEPQQPTTIETVPVLESAWGTNLLGILSFSIAFGVALGSMGENGRTARLFFDGCTDAVLMVVNVVIWFTPIGVIFLISGKIIEMRNLVRALTQLALYTATVTVGLIIHGFIVLPLIYLVVLRRNPFTYMCGCVRALLTAVSTASSSATLPVTLYCVQEVNGISKRIARFVVSVGATINMDGTALYEAVASVFIAQVNGITLDFAQLLTVSLTATLAAVGAAGVPEAGLVTMVIVLTAVGLPTEDVGLIMSIDWFLDRLRTSINVWGDCVGAAIVEHLSRDDPRDPDQETTTETDENVQQAAPLAGVQRHSAPEQQLTNDMTENPRPSGSGSRGGV